MVVDPLEVSYSDSIVDSVGSFIFWIILSAVSVVVPEGLGALIPVAGILVGLGDVENTTTGPAIVGAFFTALLSWASMIRSDGRCISLQASLAF